ncbi:MULTISPECIES: ABC transporter permease [Pseudidiomarina]|uniref:ABC transport system permease protein n=2 Tax=Pseudidiomarina TaxID=2800384 RepID=A0A368UP66_9GAMM|nr:MULTISPECIES: FtsX-like permease family protein [Pseudidiomarina]PWW11150.1 putative ABC transport system permease protein [Pseudidiomarina maritima]RBP88550.1 putative ABC transport system permease protein [Pseudidiomarina tainanensis]RCW30503.1 putative ABC transport system permease protein [Pseudidiomarina tainanensis]
MWHKISWRLLKQELKRGELTIMAAAIVLSVTAVLALSVFTERLQAGLMARSAEFLAADRVLSSGRDIPQEWITKAEQEGLQTAERVVFNSMAFAGEQLALVDIKAVGDGYPLRGELRVAEQPYGAEQVAQGLPQSGEAWVAAALFQELELAIGDTIEVGRSQFVVSKVLTYEPDVGFSVFTDSPNVLIRYQDLAATELIQPGSRVRYNQLFAGTLEQLEQYEAWLTPQLNEDTHNWRSIEDGDSPLARSLQRAERFMLLASLLGVVLAATAVAVAAQRYCQRNYDVVAIFKTLGANKRIIQRIFVLHLLLLTFISITLGLLLGWLIQSQVIYWVSQQLGTALPQSGWQPFALAAATGLVSAVMFTLYPLLRLISIPPLRVLNRDLTGNNAGRWLHWLASGGTIYALLLIYSQQWLLSSALFVGGAVAAIILLTVSRLFIRVSRQAGMQAGSSWRLAMAGLQRRAQANSVQMLSFSTAIMLLLLVLALRNELLADWQAQLPDDAPNYFVINVARDDVQNLQQRFAEREIVANDMYPIVPGRMTAVNGVPVRDEVTKEEDGDAADTATNNAEQREGFGRELQLTWRDTLPPNNTLVAGQWWGDDAQPQVSIETGVADRMNLQVGDELEFNIGGSVFTVPVTSIREVNWGSLQPNFFMIFNTATLTDFPATFISSFYLEPERKSELYELFRPFPQVSLIDLDAIIGQLREVIDQVSLAIAFVLVVVIIAGILVLLAQVQASLEEREKELVILRTLGASAKLLRQSVTYEFVILGAISGLIATLAMELALWILQTQVFDMQASIHWRFWLIGPVAGAVVVGLMGRLACGRLIKRNTAQLIRRLA